MRTRFIGLAIATLLIGGVNRPGHAEDAAAPKPAPAPTAAQPEAPPPSVARPSIAPNTAEPASPPAATEPTPRRHRRYAHRHHKRYASWEPFPIYWPHVQRHRVYWNRIPWTFRF